jgi:hypothetical protein
MTSLQHTHSNLYGIGGMVGWSGICKVIMSMSKHHTRNMVLVLKGSCISIMVSDIVTLRDDLWLF